MVADRALVSAATRTQQTWAAVADAAGWDVEPDLDEGLYAAGPETALDIVRGAPDESRTLVLIGHNPTVAYLAQLLDDGEGDPQALRRDGGGLPDVRCRGLLVRRRVGGPGRADGARGVVPRRRGA